MQSIYTAEVIKHFTHPKNVGEIKNPDGIGKVGNPKCGDVMYIYIKVGKKNGKEIIKDIKFKTLGCAAAIATSSMLTTIAKGKTLEEAEKITNADVAKALGGLPKLKMHCSLLAEQGIKATIHDYKKRKREEEMKKQAIKQKSGKAIKSEEQTEAKKSKQESKFKGKIRADMTIGDIVEKYPETFEIFTKHGMHCIGCHISPFETLEQGCLVHGINLKQILKDLNEKVK